MVLLLSGEVVISVLCVLATAGIFYVFYPAIAVDDASCVDVETVSKENHKEENDNGKVAITFVVPAYNEESRLPVMLDAALAYLSKERLRLVKLIQSIENNNATLDRIEWIIVSDGSTYATGEVVRKYGEKHSLPEGDTWKLVTLKHNSGKGAAVKKGMLLATGYLCLMVDADGATDFGKGLELLLDKMIDSESSVVFGSRAHMQEDSKAERTLLRTMLMYAFHFFVEILCSSSVRDTQCGFKLFTGQAAHELFSLLHLHRWAFDIELVILAERLGLTPIKEVGVPWHEVDGSKLDTSKFALALISIGMLRDMLCVRLCYELGIWKTKKKPVA